MSESPKLIRIHPADNVGVAVEKIAASTSLKIDSLTFSTREQIPGGHKVALLPIRRGEKVVKYGYPIGQATVDIERGSHVHLHNLHTLLGKTFEYEYTPQLTNAEQAESSTTFDGFVRDNGDVGIRNEIWIIPTVGCVNRICEQLAGWADAELTGGGLEGVYAFPHTHGCAEHGEDRLNTQKLLAGLVRHPNAGGVLLVGLGCENNHIECFRKVAGDIDPQRVKCLGTQDVEDEFEIGMSLLQDLASRVRAFRRETVPISRLRVGLKCGGSDGFSGITANPLLGVFSDQLVAAGGTTLLTEVPEMFGAETILMNRCVSRDVFDRCVRLINDFKAYFHRYNQPVYDNPSYGNKEGGLTTLEEKSLGCTQKGGTSPVVDVVGYGEPVTHHGLNLIQSSGYDGVSITALTAAGAHLILFTTGRGTPMGAPVPTVKISATSQLARRKKSWIDLDAGTLLDGKSMNDLADELFRYVMDVASGRARTLNEQNDFREIVIFKDGVTV